MCVCGPYHKAPPYDPSKVAGYAAGSCTTLVAAKAACDAMSACVGFKYLATGCFSFVLDDSELRVYVFTKHATIGGSPATLSVAAADDDNATSSGEFDGVYLKLNATVGQVAAYADEQCSGNNTLPAVRGACDALVECVGFSYAAADKMCYAFIFEEFVFTHGKALNGSMPASLKTVVAINATTGLYLLKHRAELHRVQSYGYTTCGRNVTQQKFHCDAVLECVGFSFDDDGCGQQIFEEDDVRHCKARNNCPTPDHSAHVNVITVNAPNSILLKLW